MSRIRFTIALAFLVAFGGYLSGYAQAQEAQPQDVSLPASSNADQTNPLKRKLSDKEIREQQKELRQELKGPYKKWLDQDVRWIITDQERKAFMGLSNDEERDAFIEQFWRRRNPDPQSPDNSYREEIYRRIAYSNEHFSAGKQGWLTDRGHMYIAWGPPDSIDSHPAGGTYQRPMDEGGGSTQTFPFEVWNYRHLDGIGENIDIEFVDSCMCGDYHMTINRAEKDALLHTPGGGPTMWEETGQAKRSDRFNNGFEQIGAGPLSGSQGGKEFDRMEQYAKLEAAPTIKFKDLDEFITSHRVLTGPFFPFDVRTDFVRVTDDTVLVPITLQIRNRDITYNTKDGVSRGVVNILGRVSTITGRIAQTFEDTVEVDEPAELLPKTLDSKSVYWKSLPLRPGRYRLDIVIKDVNNPDHIGTYARAFVVPEYDDDKLAASSLILADKMQQVPSKDIGSGQFVIGNTFIRPRVSGAASQPVTFKRDQDLDFWMQVYNLKINPKTKQNDATVHYLVTDMGNHKTLFEATEVTSKLNPNSDQVTLEKSMPLASLQPGKYQITISVDDGVSKQQLAQSAPFEVTQ
ncbi:MAG TPA: GWxTD domain-containing protein [Acidobacteriaceae bacterium]|nr:GWxTD domain-containing protein [Acidobacteriaceae bacterium]